MSENADFIHRLYAAFARGDIATILAALAPDVDWVCEGPASLPFCGTFRGREQVSKFFQALATTQSDEDLKIDETYEAGDQVFTINRYSCVVNATGKRIDSRGLHLFYGEEREGGAVPRNFRFSGGRGSLQGITSGRCSLICAARKSAARRFTAICLCA